MISLRVVSSVSRVSYFSRSDCFKYKAELIRGRHRRSCRSQSQQFDSGVEWLLDGSCGLVGVEVERHGGLAVAGRLRGRELDHLFESQQRKKQTSQSIPINKHRLYSYDLYVQYRSTVCVVCTYVYTCIRYTKRALQMYSYVQYTREDERGANS